MEPIEEFIIFSESGDRLKEICERLLEVCKGEESLLARSVSRLIPTVNSTISVTVLNKLIFVWENFTVLQSCDEVPLLLELIRTVLHSYIEECVLPHNAGSVNSGFNIDESLTRSQRALRLMISVCQFGRHLDDSKLLEIASLLQTILFPTSAECSEHIEVSALAGTALCNLIILRETDLFVEYQKLCPPDAELRFGHIAMISGILSISKGLGEQETHSLAPALMSNILKMCHDDLNTYHSFSCLLKFLRSHLFVDLLNADTDSVQKSIVHLLWLKIDSPVKGVSELVSSCLQVLLRVCHKHVKGCVPLHQQLIERVPVTGCHVRSHLKILAVLLPWINLEDFLTTSPHFITKLAHCMSVQHMVSAAAKIYSALIEKTTLLLWQQLVMRAFIQALTSKVKLTRNNVKEYWLPATLTKLPKAGEVLMLELRNSTDCGQGVLDVYAACRYRAIQVQLPVTLLESSLVSGNDEVRLAAIEVICKPPQTASAIVNEEEIHLLETYLAYNLNIDCPSFRRCIKASLNSHIDRSCHIVTNSKDANAVEYIVNHLSWLWQLLRESLVRGSNYQRKETVMDLCISFVKKLSKLYQELSLSDKQSLLHSVTCEEKPRCPRGRCSCSLTQFKSRVVKVCLLDSSSQIQDLGLKFLTLHVSKGFQTTWGDDNSYILDSFSLWTKYITSAKASEAESGAKLYTLIVSKAMKEPHKFFNEDVIGQIEQVISLAEKDHTSIVTSLHVHGYLIAVRQALRHTPYLSTLNNTQLALLGKRLISVCHRSATLVLEILSAACDNKEVSPSFEQMEVAVNELIERALGGPVSDISELSERVTAWCWLTLKEACSLCGAITLSSEKYKDLLTQTAADTIRSIFFSTLTKCRHRGVIEGSCEGLLDFCAVMRRSGDRGLSSLPSSIINQVLDMSVRSEDSASGCSVTRRSGGFPLIIQNVLASHPSNKQAISTVVDELLHLTHDIASAQKDDTTDMSQVHAFNILKALVTDARLLYTMRSYLARVTIKSIQAFSSPVWALRNAATQLFAACSLRMLGQRGEAEHRSAGTGSAEFFSQYPLLYTYLKEELRGSNSGRRPAQLYPLLSLVSRLSSPIHHVTESNSWTMQPFREAILRLFGHPLYGVRVMLPHCVIATVDTLHEMVDLCSALFTFLNTATADTNLLSYLSSSASSTTDTSARNTSVTSSFAKDTSAFTLNNMSANTSHTILVTIYEMIKIFLKNDVEEMENDYVKEELVNLRRCLWENAVLFLATSASGVLQACYIDILLIWRNKSDWSPFGQDLELWLHSVLSAPSKQTPGAALLVEKCSLLYQYIAGCESWLAVILGSQSIMTKSLLFSLDLESVESSSAARIQAWLVQEIISLENWQTSYELRFYTQLVDMLVQCLKVSGMLVPSARLRVLHSTLADDTSARYLLISLLVRDCVPTTECRVLSELLKWSEPDVGEDIHTNVCDCIDVIVSSFELQQFSQHNILQLMDILLSLLHNEQPEVRIRCSVSVTNLSRLARSLHHNTCVVSNSIHHLYDIHPPSDTPVHFNIAIQQVLGLLPLLLNIDTTLWVRWLLNHMHSNMTHFTDLIHQPDKVSKMFFQEELNVFYERTILVKAVVALLCSALSTGLVFDAPKVERIESVLPEGMQQSYRELLSCYQQLSDYCASSKCQ